MVRSAPRLDLDGNFFPPMINPYAHSNSYSPLPPDVPSLDFEVTELKLENGQPAMHGLGPPRVPNKPTSSNSPTRATGTLESIVNQATRHQPQQLGAMDCGGDNTDELVSWLQRHPDTANPAAGASLTMNMDALVPCNNINDNILRNKTQEHSTHVLDFVPCSTRLGSCNSAAANSPNSVDGRGLARVGMSSCGTNGSVSDNGTCMGRESRQLTLDTYERELGGTRYTSTSLVSQENTISGREYTKATADLDSVSHRRSQACERDQIGYEEGKRGTGKLSVSTKRTRAAANHNQSERKRRDKINQRIKTLQTMVPNSSKTDKASILDEVIEYLKKLQAQVHMMGMSHMMLPLAMQQQLQMSMMAGAMGMGMGMGVMDMNNIGRAVAGLPPVVSPTTTATFKPAVVPADNISERLRAAPLGPVVSDPLQAFLTCQSQPASMDAYYRRLAALYQQLHQAPGSGSEN